ncbi:MAG TPA: TonB-dependent receptor, partial [Pseudoxanthomonas sp.]|nr:TonB-dependent receptor [Pseudoxanthomonas sp.]
TSKADNSLKQWFIEPVYVGGYSWSIDRGIDFDDTDAARDPANWAGDGFMGNYGQFDTDSKDTYAQVDFNVAFDSVLSNLQFGVRRGKHEENFLLNVYTGLPVADLATVGTIGLTDIRGFGDDHGRHIQVGRGNTINYVNSFRGSLSPDAGSFLNNTFSVEQTNTAAYVQGDFSFDRLRGNVGLRYVRSETDAGGFVYSGTPSFDDLDSKFQVNRKKEDFLLPSLNLVYETGSDLLFRFGAAKVIAWAPYNQLANNTFLNDTTLTGSGGNADVSPYESNNFNVAAEWYFAPESVLAASVFYKQIDNYIDTGATIERQFNSISDDVPPSPLFASLVASGVCSADGMCDYSISRPRNAGKGKVKGFNISYQAPFGETGFGLTANYTYADGENNTGDPLPYQSRDSVAISPYYEREALSVRLAYNWRSDYLAGGYVAGSPPASVDDYAELSASIGWKFTDNLSLSLEALNLLDSEYFQYLGDESLPAAQYRTGRRFMASLRFNF